MKSIPSLAPSVNILAPEAARAKRERFPLVRADQLGRGLDLYDHPVPIVRGVGNPPAGRNATVTHGSLTATDAPPVLYISIEVEGEAPIRFGLGPDAAWWAATVEDSIGVVSASGAAAIVSVGAGFAEAALVLSIWRSIWGDGAPTMNGEGVRE